MVGMAKWSLSQEGFKAQQIEFLNDLDRGNYDCQHGNQAREDESDAYYIAYGARYVMEQNKSKEEFYNE